MSTVSIYYLLSAILLTYVAFRWSINGFLNTMFKFAFSGTAIFGIVLFLGSIGVVVVK